MLYRVMTSAAVLAALVPAGGAAAEPLPPIKLTGTNQVPACVTPGRLAAFLKSRNPTLTPEHERIGVEYMRHGETLAIRWDYAFFQMVVETGYLTFRRDAGRRGDVSPEQNNFAGLGATGRGVKGESFPDVSTGVQAHLQHVLMYTGAAIANPVAERTRKVMQWRVLDEWREGIAGPMTFAHLAEKWAANDSYAEAIATHARLFREGFCNAPDPQPALLAEARKGRAIAAGEPAPASPSEPATRERRAEPAVSGRELARRAVEEANAAGDTQRRSLGAGSLTARGAGEAAKAPAVAPPSAAGSGLLQAAAAVGDLLKSMAGRPDAGAVTPPASATTGKQRCQVWTASYGGGKAMIIKAPTSDGVSYTVLDVNEGAEQKEAAAYIAAYAQGGRVEQVFQTQAQALERAFQICPEG